MTCLHRLQTTFLSRMQLCSRRKRREEEEDEKLARGGKRASELNSRWNDDDSHSESPTAKDPTKEHSKSAGV